MQKKLSFSFSSDYLTARDMSILSSLENMELFDRDGQQSPFPTLCLMFSHSVMTQQQCFTIRSLSKIVDRLALWKFLRFNRHY